MAETTLSSLADLNQAAVAAAQEAPKYVQKLDKQGRALATGKRKNAIARVWIKPGTAISVNGRDVAVYFARPVLRMIIQQPLGIAKRTGQYDLTVTVAGGVSPVRRAPCVTACPSADLLRARSAHAAEARRLPDPRLAASWSAKKYGKRKARRSFQFSKR